MAAINVLVIDDDPNIRRLLNELLSAKPEYRVILAADGREAVRCFAEERVDVVLTDIHMPGFTGLELMADMKKIKFRPEILVMTANATPENVETARQVGARSVILKPFDNLDVVEAEIDKAVRAVHQSRAGAVPPTAAAPSAAAPSAAPPSAPRPQAPARPVVPGPPRAAARPAAPHAPRPPAAVQPAELPDLDAWKADLSGNETPAAPQRPAATAPPRPPAARPPAAAASRPTRPAAATPPVSHVPAPPAPAEPAENGTTQAAATIDVPEMPTDLEEIFHMAASLDLSRMQMQVPIIALQTWEEKGAEAALRLKAAALSREFYTWSAAKGILKDGQPMGDMYREPTRALEFIRRQKQSGMYLLADFRQCLEDRTVVRVLREMVMELETGRHLLVMTAPSLPVPPELQPACALFDWPAGGAADLETLYEEVAAEVAASTGLPVRLDRGARRDLLDRVREMPQGRARFEIARVLMAAAKRSA